MITIQEAQWQLTEKIHGLERLEGAAAIYEWQEQHGITRRESRDHVRRIWVKDGGRFGCDECGTMPDYLKNEEDSAKLRDVMLLAMSPRDWFDTIISASVALTCAIPFGEGEGLAARNNWKLNENWRRCQLLAALRWKKIDVPYELMESQ